MRHLKVIRCYHALFPLGAVVSVTILREIGSCQLIVISYQLSVVSWSQESEEKKVVLTFDF
ncbi:hypothetical protein [Chroococcidiopsis sp.]|uniref:hypothetical protein n=1 Tax=Chroococcidiopsis sp. TaxID=3088168 RepID=UPI003F2F391E